MITGSLALGGLLSGLAIVARTDLLLVVHAAACSSAMALSVVVAVAFFRDPANRPGRCSAMAPLHHHFELAGWTGDCSVIMQLAGIASAIAVALGIGLVLPHGWRGTGGGAVGCLCDKMPLLYRRAEVDTVSL